MADIPRPSLTHSHHRLYSVAAWNSQKTGPLSLIEVAIAGGVNIAQRRARVQPDEQKAGRHTMPSGPF